MAIRMYPHKTHKIEFGDALPNVMSYDYVNVLLQAHVEGSWEEDYEGQTECEVSSESLQEFIENLKDKSKRKKILSEFPDDYFPLETEHDWQQLIQNLEKLYEVGKHGDYVHWSWY